MVLAVTMGPTYDILVQILSFKYLIHYDKAELMHPLVFYQAIDERVCLLDSGHVKALPLETLTRWYLTLAGCVLLYDKVKFHRKWTQPTYLVAARPKNTIFKIGKRKLSVYNSPERNLGRHGIQTISLIYIIYFAIQ